MRLNPKREVHLKNLASLPQKLQSERQRLLMVSRFPGHHPVAWHARDCPGVPETRWDIYLATKTTTEAPCEWSIEKTWLDFCVGRLRLFVKTRGNRGRSEVFHHDFPYLDPMNETNSWFRTKLWHLICALRKKLKTIEDLQAWQNTPYFGQS